MQKPGKKSNILEIDLNILDLLQQVGRKIDSISIKKCVPETYEYFVLKISLYKKIDKSDDYLNNE